MNALDLAIKAAGGVTKLAGVLSLRQSAISNWRTRGVPLEHCAAIESATSVRCEELRPDVLWQRDKKGRVTGYTVAVNKAA